MEPIKKYHKNIPDDETAHRVVGVVSEIYGIELIEIDLDDNYEKDFESDNLDKVEFLYGLEDEFAIRIADEEVQGLTTVGNTIEYIKKKTCVDADS